MDLFLVVNNELIVSPHALMIDPFMSMWDMDEDADKFECKRIFKYVELLCSPKKSNPFYGYSETERPAKVKEHIFKDIHYQSDVYNVSWIIQAITAYKDHLAKSAPGYSLHIAASNAADKLTNFLNSFDLTERTRTGAMILKPKDITSALRDIPEVVKGLALARATVNSEVNEFKTKGEREIGIFEEEPN